jgi:hypothetical protein
MSASEVYWPHVAMGTLLVATIPFLYFAFKRRWSWTALVVAIANLVVVALNGAAPIRGAVDPNYVGYGFGFLSADRGLPVTLIAGAVVLASAFSAWIAVRNRAGAAMLLVAATAAFHAVNVGFPLLDSLLTDPTSVTIQFGEYLTVPHTVAIPALIALMFLPFLLGTAWALQRARETE